MNTLEKAGLILGVILFAVIGFWWVNCIDIRDIAVIQNYEQECGQDVICLRNVYYKYNLK